MVLETDFSADSRARFAASRFFFAAAKILGDEFIPHLRRMLSTTKLFRKAAMEEVYQCAAFALKSIGSDEALDTLKYYETHGNKAVRQFCGRELRKGSGQ